MGIVKNCMIVIVFGILLVGMMFMGVTMIEAKDKKMRQSSSERIYNWEGWNIYQKNSILTLTSSKQS